MSAFHLFLFYVMLLVVVIYSAAAIDPDTNMETSTDFTAVSQVQLNGYSSSTVPPVHPKHRKLKEHGVCSTKDISISQSKDSSSGIPQYIVQIVNTCISGCAPSKIHLHCGWFASARMVNPRTFKRLSFDDCLVNGGRPLRNSQIIRFTYSNSFMYPLQLKSARFC